MSIGGIHTHMHIWCRLCWSDGHSPIWLTEERIQHIANIMRFSSSLPHAIVDYTLMAQLRVTKWDYFMIYNRQL